MTDGDKQQITFETEGDIHEDIKVLVAEINKNIKPDSPEMLYLNGVNKMFALFEDTYAKNVKLLETCQEMNAQVVINASKIQAILAITSKDKDQMKTLKADFEEASKMVNFAHAAETKAKNLLTVLRDKVTNLSEMVQKGEAFSFGEEGSIFEISQDVKNLKIEKNNASKEITDYQNQIIATKAKFKGLTDDINTLKSESERLTTQIANFDKQNVDLNAFNEETSNAVMKLKPEIVQQKHELENLTKKKNDSSKSKSQKKHSQYEVLNTLSALRDESRTLKEKVLRRTKFASDLRANSSNKEANLEEIKKKIENRTQEIEKCKQELKGAQKAGDEYNAKFNEIMQTSRNIGDKKLEYRQDVRKLRSKLVDLQFAIAKSDNQTIQHNRHITTEKLDLCIQKRHREEEVRQTAEVHDQAITVRSEMKITKTKLQVMKEKVLTLFQEIDDKRTEKLQALAKIQMTIETINLTNEQNKQQLNVLEEYERKAEDQMALIDKTREERNIYKRQYESIMKEYNALKSDYDQLSSEYQEMQNHLEELKVQTVETHFQNVDSKSHIMSLNVLVEKCRKSIQETDRITSRLQAEGQTLNFILAQGKNDKLQQEQERQLLLNNINMVSNEVYSKIRKLDQIRSQITTDEAYLKKCSKMFNDKTAEMVAALDELARLQQKTNELEKRREKMTTLEYKMHRFVAENMIEQQKYVALIHEFSVPRNVHRWHALGAVDPHYVKQLKYRSLLSAKIESSHKELLDLQAQRDKLKEQYEKMKSKYDSNIELTVAKANEYIEQYNQDLKEKDMQLRELKKQVNGNKPDLQKSIKDIDNIREKVTQRRGMTASLTTRNRQIIKKQNQLQNQMQMQLQFQNGSFGVGVTVPKVSTISSNGDPQPWFLTEAPIYNVLGGGFVTRQSQFGNQNNSIENHVDLTVGSATAHSATRRAQSSLISPNMKKIAKPLRSAQTRAQSRIRPQFP
ncbi:hypothetical protein M9Y10_027358 [Tritrichomonas musculus]|uniref:Uncharacterized protein n=1 Tax=Tritrichomonas musculus TaxID=1915356 RepID=A0ABR2H5N3_9EUKA